ncbi:MAG: bifunctional diguanylate cyclase/phosphodiesterase [Peptococcaceae bacterium]|nr:bifunctional diguanylate cyclase/phosphodiesterase [Peptococcaceae bacterium]
MQYGELINLLDQEAIKGFNADLEDLLYSEKEMEMYSQLLLLQEKMDYYRHYDALTGVYNKRTFVKKVSEEIQQRPERNYLLVRFDIERFKIINELFGREEGDKLLKFIANALKYTSAICKDIIYGRWHNDVFVMCVPYEGNYVYEIVNKLSYLIGSYKLNFDVKPYFGIYPMTDRSLSIEMMCDRAHLALKRIKGSALKNYTFYNQQLHQQLLREQDLMNQMTTALNEDQFMIYLQPKYELNKNAIVGAEALVRWNHPVEGLISPAEFVPIFERNGFIMKLDEYIWEQTCRLIRKWLDEGRLVSPISVNVSKVNLYNPELCDKIIGLTKKYNVPPELLALEITESAYVENSSSLNDAMICLQSHGFSIMMDDFGSGYSSLNMLKDLFVDVLKIDLCFLSGDSLGSRGSSILASVVDMARKLSLDIVAEGIETKEQADFLKKIGCAKGQGYYFSKPVPVQEYERMMYH